MGIGPRGFSVPEQLRALPEFISRSFFLQPFFTADRVLLVQFFRCSYPDSGLVGWLKPLGLLEIKWVSPGGRALSPECCFGDEGAGFQVMGASRVCFVPEYDWRVVYLDLNWEGHYNLC